MGLYFDSLLVWDTFRLDSIRLSNNQSIGLRLIVDEFNKENGTTVMYKKIEDKYSR